MLLRPVAMDDHKALLKVARLAGIGMTSLPPDPDVLAQKIEHSVRSFAGKLKKPGEEGFLFVLEDTESKKLAGTTGVYAHVGLSRPFYSYKLSTIVQASQDVDVYSRQRVLHMVNDYTGASEVGSLFLMPEYRRDGLGKFLSRSRFLMMAEFPDLFADTVISEIRGVQDAKGDSPFYDNLARHFFKMEFKEADYITATQGTQFISDLMPKYPIYVALLTKAAQEVIGQPLEASRPAKAMLESEGFRHQGYVDVFDAGPTMQAERRQIKTVRESHRARIENILDKPTSTRAMFCTTSLKNFRMCPGTMDKTPGGGVAVDAGVAARLCVKIGDEVRVGV